MSYFGFPLLWIFLFQYLFGVFMCSEWWWGQVNGDEDIVRESFSIKFILHSLWYTPLVYVFVNLFFNVVFCVCSFVVFFSTWCCQCYMNYWTHPPFNCWQNRPDYWGCRNGKKKYLINYIGLHIFVKCDQKSLFTVPSTDQ